MELVKGAAATSSVRRVASPESDVIARPGHFRRFQIIKGTSFGLGSSQGFKLDIHAEDGFHGDTNDFHTTTLPFFNHGLFLPASFDVMRGPRPPPEQHLQQGEEIAGSVKYKGFEGMFSMKADIDLGEPRPHLKYAHKIPHSLGRRLEITRQGMGRHYSIEMSPCPMRLKWKGTIKALQLLEGDDTPDCNGNLKLVNEANPFQPEVLAVWKNRTDPHIMGALWVLEPALEDGDIMLEDILCSCLAIVCAERMSGRGWLGIGGTK